MATYPLPGRRLNRSAATPTAGAVAADALRLIRYPWQGQLPGWSLRFDGQQPGFLGRTIWPDRVIEIYVRPGQAVRDVAFAVAHELGHAVDLEHLDPSSRARWRAGRMLPNHLEWFGASDADDFATPAGDWAECFAAWQLGPAGFQSQLGGAPDAGHCVLLAELSLLEHADSTDRAPGQGGRFPHFVPQAGVRRARYFNQR